MTLSYDLSFEKRELVLLAVLSAGIGGLLVVGGFLAGRISSAPSASLATVPPISGAVLPTSTLPDAAKPAADDGLAATDAPAGSAAPVSGLAAAPAAGDAQTDPAQPMYTLQFGAFHERANADALAKDLDSMKVKVQVTVKKNSAGEAFWVVRSGTFDSASEATDAARQTANTVGKPVLVRPAERL